MTTSPFGELLTPYASAPAPPWHPFALDVETGVALLDCPLVGDPDYDGLELRWFDDPRHGRGLLVSLRRAGDGRVDRYRAPTLRLERWDHEQRTGTGVWTILDAARGELAVTARGVHADVRFRDVAGRSLEVVLDGQARRTRGRTTVLATALGGQRPRALRLVLLHHRGRLRTGARTPVVRIDGRQVSSGSLPGAWRHRRPVVTLAAPVTTVHLNRTDPSSGWDRPQPVVEPDLTGRALARLSVGVDGASADLRFRPAFPDVRHLDDGEDRRGSWRLDVDGRPAVLGGTWHTRRVGPHVAVTLEAVRSRRWPTTGRWTADVDLGAGPSVAGQWDRAGSGDASGHPQRPGATSAGSGVTGRGSGAPP